MRIGIALGGGGAKGWAHIGVLRALIDAGVTPEIVAGTSMGAIVGGAYAAGRLDALEEFARNLDRKAAMALVDFNLPIFVQFRAHFFCQAGVENIAPRGENVIDLHPRPAH